MGRAHEFGGLSGGLGGRAHEFGGLPSALARKGDFGGFRRGSFGECLGSVEGSGSLRLCRRHDGLRVSYTGVTVLNSSVWIKVSTSREC